MTDAQSGTDLVTPEQKRLFDAQGFLVFSQIFSPAEMAEISEATDRVLRKCAAEIGHDGTATMHVFAFHEGDEFLSRMLEDSRINDIVEALIGEDCAFRNWDGHYYSGNTRWHSDGGVPGFPVVHMIMYPDPVSDGNGCLSLIPGSHHQGYLEGIDNAMKTGLYDRSSPEVPGRYAIESQPGDVVVFHHAMYHSSWGGKNRRRMFSLSYESASTVSWQGRYLRGNVEDMPHMKAGHRIYSDRLVETAGPRLKRKLRSYIDMGFCDQSRKPLEKPFSYIYRPSQVDPHSPNR